MNSIIFEMGQKVRCTPDCGDRSGMLGEVVGSLTQRSGFGASGKEFRKAYRVKWSDGVVTPATQIALEPAPPVRGDLDTKIDWCWFDPALVFTIKNGPNVDY